MLINQVKMRVVTAVILTALISYGVDGSGCPMSICDCETDNYGNQIINCKSKGLTEVPSITPSAQVYSELTLAENDITTIPPSAFRGLIVKKIDLQENPITHVDREAFVGVEPTLETLILHGHKENISTPIPWSSIANLTALQELQLSYFDVQNIQDDSVFTGLTNLQSLKISNTLLSYIKPTVVQPLRQMLETLDLSRNQFMSLPVSSIRLLTSLKKLILSSNHIRSLDYNAFETNSRLDELDLSQNLISSLEPGCFNNITDSLTFLGLGLNRLSGTKLQPIADLRALQQLTLNHNALVSIPSGMFRNLHNLVFLNLINTQLSSLTTETFQGLGGMMSHLTLSVNRLSSIEPGTFAAMTNLRDLDLYNQTDPNFASTIVPGVFRGLENSLQSLNLGSTRFGSIQNWAAIKNMTGLQTLQLSENGLASIPDMIFSDLTQLETLDLHQNNLSNITQRTFHGLRDSLRNLQLQKNSLTSFDHCTFKNYSMLKPEGVNLANNPLACDCKLRWLSEWLETRLNESDPRDRFIIRLRTHWKCDDGRWFRDINPEDFVCAGNFSDPICINYYTTTTSTTTSTTTTAATTTVTTTTETTTPLPTVDLVFKITNVSSFEMSLQWSVSHPSEVKYYEINYEDLFTSEKKRTQQIYHTTVYQLTQLEPSHPYEVCLSVYFNRLNSQIKCLTKSTAPQATTAPSSASGMNSEEIGIIVGSAVGGVLLIIIIVVIVFILIRYRQQENEQTKRVQSSPWQRAGKPHEVYDSKRFTRQKQKSPGEHHIKEIRHVQGDNSLQRASAGSYQYLDRVVDNKPMNGFINSTHPVSPTKGLDTTDLYHKYYEIALDGVETHI